jgi:cell division protein FtsW
MGEAVRLGPAGRVRTGVAAIPAPRRPAAPRRSALQRERHEPDYLILVATVALTAIGVLMIYSTSGVRSFIDQSDSFSTVLPQMLWALLGLVALGVTARLDYRYLRTISVVAYLGAVALLAVLLLEGDHRVVVGQSARWLQLESLPAFHPAEFAKLALVIYLAHWLARRGSSVGSLLQGTVPFLVIAGLPILLVFLEPDLGTTGVLTLTAFTMFFVAGARLWQFLVLVPVGITAVAYAVLSEGYQLERVQTFLDPWADPLGRGYHTVQGLLSLGVGGLFGTGLGVSRQLDGLYLPNAQNDFIFAVVGQEFGLLGGATVIGLFLVLAYRGLRVALAAPDTFGALLATGITAWLVLQAFINIAVVVNLIPITGITLPFVSDGGSSLLVSFVAVGILLSISRETLPRGAWNDADPDRRWRNGRAHLPGVGGPSRPAHAAGER